ncbi:MAG: endonuclease III domain-containing protein [Candidatus Omnitrophica bacterium]|nr:endonuclease III domain-containing protein [Candidatus Omnitrophota bacterium]
MKRGKVERKSLLAIYNRLLRSYGPREWWPAKTRFEVIVGAILTQNVSWHNAKIAINNLKRKELLLPKSMLKAPYRQIANCIKSSRFYNQKAKKLKTFCRYLALKYDGSLDKMFFKDMNLLRNELLDLKGIGKETADCILLYAGKKPSFVVDAYTKRFLARYGLGKEGASYDEIRRLFMENLPKNVYLYNEYHALIVHHCHFVCKSKPQCAICSVNQNCLGFTFSGSII